MGFVAHVVLAYLVKVIKVEGGQLVVRQIQFFQLGKVLLV